MKHFKCRNKIWFYVKFNQHLCMAFEVLGGIQDDVDIYPDIDPTNQELLIFS